jgi:hypothetical protein
MMPIMDASPHAETGISGLDIKTGELANLRAKPVRAQHQIEILDRAIRQRDRDAIANLVKAADRGAKLGA